MTGDPAQRLHPVLLHHIVNSLGWPDLHQLQQAAVDPCSPAATRCYWRPPPATTAAGTCWPYSYASPT